MKLCGSDHRCWVDYRDLGLPVGNAKTRGRGHRCNQPPRDPGTAGLEPEPDLAVVAREDHGQEHPTKAFLVIEVADASLQQDRRTKAEMYAAASIPDYWVVNLVDRLVEVHRDIVRGSYSRITPYGPGQTLRLEEFPDVEVAVDYILPRQARKPPSD